LLKLGFVTENTDQYQYQHPYQYPFLWDAKELCGIREIVQEADTVWNLVASTDIQLNIPP
jgi:hypothetical protein